MDNFFQHQNRRKNIFSSIFKNIYIYVALPPGPDAFGLKLKRTGSRVLLANVNESGSQKLASLTSNWIFFIFLNTFQNIAHHFVLRSFLLRGGGWGACMSLSWTWPGKKHRIETRRGGAYLRPPLETLSCIYVVAWYLGKYFHCY